MVPIGPILVDLAGRSDLDTLRQRIEVRRDIRKDWFLIDEHDFKEPSLFNGVAPNFAIGGSDVDLVGSVRLVELSHLKNAGLRVDPKESIIDRGRDVVSRVLLHDVVDLVAAKITAPPVIYGGFGKPRRKIN